MALVTLGVLAFFLGWWLLRRRSITPPKAPVPNSMQPGEKSVRFPESSAKSIRVRKGTDILLNGALSHVPNDISGLIVGMCELEHGGKRVKSFNVRSLDDVFTDEFTVLEEDLKIDAASLAAKNQERETAWEVTR